MTVRAKQADGAIVERQALLDRDPDRVDVYQELVRFSVSEEYFHLRAKLGIQLRAG